MNTKKALNMVILLLFIINLFMLGFILYSSTELSSKSDKTDYVSDILTYRGIELKGSIDSNESRKNSVLFKGGIFDDDFIAHANEVTGGSITVYEDQTIMQYSNANEGNDTNYLSDRFDADAKIRSFLDEIGFNHINFVVDTVVMSSRNKYHITYIYVINGEILYDLYINAIIDEYGVSSIGVKYIENEVDTSKTYEIMPITNVLLGNVTLNKTGSNVIERIDTGYKLNDRNTLDYLLRVTYEDKKIVFYNTNN